VIKDIIMRFTEYWLLCFGIIVVAMVMCFPSGVMSIFENRRRSTAPPDADRAAKAAKADTSGKS
jgi:hypothetical protein